MCPVSLWQNRFWCGPQLCLSSGYVGHYHIGIQWVQLVLKDAMSVQSEYDFLFTHRCCQPLRVGFCSLLTVAETLRVMVELTLLSVFFCLKDWSVDVSVAYALTEVWCIACTSVCICTPRCSSRLYHSSCSGHLWSSASLRHGVCVRLQHLLGWGWDSGHCGASYWSGYEKRLRSGLLLWCWWSQYWHWLLSSHLNNFPGLQPSLLSLDHIFSQDLSSSGPITNLWLVGGWNQNVFFKWELWARCGGH